MDYKNLAEELLSIRTELFPTNQMMDNFARGELFALNYLTAHSGTAFPKDLSRGMNVSSARVAAVLKQMEKKGWINRTVDTRDSRQTVITLTDAGWQAIKARKEEIIDVVAQMLEGLGPEDAKELLRIERKIMKSR